MMASSPSCIPNSFSGSSSPATTRPEPVPRLERQETDLPIETAASAITDSVREGALVLTAEPGAGKSSIVPLLTAAVLDDASPHPRVVVLEPRRLAVRATAQRLDALLAQPTSGVGDVIGLSMRGEHRVGKNTRIEVMTEAVLTNRLQRDPELPGIGAIIFDEFHERNLHSDLSLAMALQARSTIRDDLAIVVMSATLAPEPVANLLETDNIISVPGRTFPVETIHLERPRSARWAAAVITATERALSEGRGDVLVFVPGRREIDDVVGRLSQSPVEAIGLHGSSDANVQRRVLTGGGGRRVIVATSVAETSITLPGIEAVVDGGLLRRARYDPITGLGRLETVNVTRFSADQRRGRAGRLGPGRCYRLWSVEDHRHLDDATPPEIVDGDPLPVSFELARWGDPDASSLPLLDHPGTARLAAGCHLLSQLELTDPAGALTDRGRRAAEIGVHPRVGSLLLTAERLDLLSVGSATAAVLDDDRWAAGTDLAAEVERRWRDLAKPAKRLRQRLRRKEAQRDHGRQQIADLPGLLAAAWPDRIASARPNRPGHFLMANGREASVRPGDPLARAEFLVVAEGDGEARSANVRRAVSIDRTTLTEAAAQHLRWSDHVAWDDRSDRIVAERRRCLGAIVLHASPLQDPPPELVRQALSVGLGQLGLDLLRWNARSIAIRQRLAWLHDQSPERWPAVDDDALLQRLDEWLDLSRCRTPADVRALSVGTSLLDLLGWQQRADFDVAAPEAIDGPGGRTLKLDYSAGRPVCSVRLQFLFGLDAHPVVGPGSVPVTIELLSPANRPAQVTTDLPGFWRGSYAAVRADLRGRYPKHPWPDEPWNEQPPPPRRRR